MTEKFVSIKHILDKLYRDLGTSTELSFDDIVEWTHESLMFIGAFSQFNKKLSYLDVTNHKATIPCDFYKIQQVTYNGGPIRYSGGTIDNSFHCTDCVNLKCVCDDYYYVNDSYIVTSFPTGTLCLSYLAVPVDSDGFPMIPDEQYYFEAITNYVIYKLDYQQWRQALITDKVYMDSYNKWSWYTQAARSKGNMPSLSQLESLKNILVRLKPLMNEYNNMFSNLGKPERKKIH